MRIIIKTNEYFDMSKLGFISDHIETDFLATFVPNNNKINIKCNFELLAIPLYNSLDYYAKNSDKSFFLAPEILEKMNEFQPLALDIIYRWRRSQLTSYNYKNIKSAYRIILEYWYSFLLKNRIDIVFLDDTPHIPLTFILYSMCKVLDIPIVVSIGLAATSKQRYLRYLTTDIFANNNFNLKGNLVSRFNEKGNEIYENLRVNYTNINERVDRSIVIDSKLAPLRKIRLVSERGILYLNQRRFLILLKKILYYIKINYESNRLLLWANGLSSIPNQDDVFVFFPLHYQPEATTLPLGRTSADQLMLIELIRNCLPKNIILYVKEHPLYWETINRHESAKESRNREFYSYFKRHDNVKLIDYNFSSLDLIDKSLCVITVNGSVSLEAAFKSKKVIVFGYSIYNRLPNAIYVKNKHDLIEAFKAIADDQSSELLTSDLREFFYKFSDFFYTVPILNINSKLDLIKEHSKNDLINFIYFYKKYMIK